MFEGKKILGIIPARGGSKGVPRKNIREVAGKPLIAWTIEEAKKSRYLDQLILSSEDAEIIAVAKKYDCAVPFIRPASLSQDDTPGIDPVLHALTELPGFDYVMLLQPTSALRTATDIDACIERCLLGAHTSCVAVTEVEEHPNWMYRLGRENRLQPLIETTEVYARRQDLPAVYLINGAAYIAQVDWLKRTRSFIGPDSLGYVMPKSRSLDIDTEADLLELENILKQK